MRVNGIDSISGHGLVKCKLNIQMNADLNVFDFGYMDNGSKKSHGNKNTFSNIRST